MPALLNPHAAQDVGSLVIGAIGAGAGLVCALDTASWSSSNQNSDVRGLCGKGMRNQRTKRTGRLTFKAFGASTTGFASSSFDLSAVTVGGVNIVPQLYSFTVSGSFDKAPLPSIGVTGTASGVMGQNYNGSLELQIDDTDVVQALIVAAEAADNTGAQMVLSFTLNGNVVTFPVQLDGDTHAFNQGQFQKVTIPFASQAPARAVNFPTNPSGSLPGSPGLLDYAFLSPRSSLAFDFISKTSHGIRRQGFLTWDSFTLTVADGAVTDFSYAWETLGDWTTTNTGA